MGDTDANVRIQLRTYMERHPIAGFRDWNEPGAERIRAAIEHAIGQERPKHFVEPWKIGAISAVKAVHERAANMVKDASPALNQVARARGYFNHKQAPTSPQSDPESFYTPKAHSYVTEPQGTWEKSKYEHLQAPAEDPMQKIEAVRSRYVDLPDPPRKQNGDIDFDKLSELTGHRPYTGPGSASTPRILGQPDGPYKSRF